MVRKSYNGYWYIPIEYIEEIASLREIIRRIIKNESKVFKK